jgi:hypothetical protein
LTWAFAALGWDWLPESFIRVLMELAVQRVVVTDVILPNADFLAAPSKPMVNRPEGKLMKDENEQGSANFFEKKVK